MVYTNLRGERKEKWFPTKLPVKGNKTRAEAFSRKILLEFEIPREDLCYHEVKEDSAIDESQPIEPQLLSALLEKVTLSELSSEQVANLLFADYIKMYLPLTKKRKRHIEETTYAGYCENVRYPIEPYFRKRKIRLNDLSAQDIQDFYDVQLERVKPNTVIHYHVIIKLALCYARKMGYIKENPIEQVDKPEKNKFIGIYYTPDEVNQLIFLTKGTKLEITAIFACFYGLRRSECVGLRWSDFDFENNTFTVQHNVVSAMVDGKKKLLLKDNLKTAASVRTLPLDLNIKKRLIEIKENRNQGKNKEWRDYVMLDESGSIIKPDYITYAFRKLLINSNMRMIRFHDLRHPYVKLKLKILSAYFSRTFGAKVLDFPHDFNPVIGIYTHLFDKHIGKCLR